MGPIASLFQNFFKLLCRPTEITLYHNVIITHLFIIYNILELFRRNLGKYLHVSDYFVYLINDECPDTLTLRDRIRFSELVRFSNRCDEQYFVF